jgi:hypothetical protein
VRYAGFEPTLQLWQSRVLTTNTNTTCVPPENYDISALRLRGGCSSSELKGQVPDVYSPMTASDHGSGISTVTQERSPDYSKAIPFGTIRLATGPGHLTGLDSMSTVELCCGCRRI